MASVKITSSLRFGELSFSGFNAGHLVRISGKHTAWLSAEKQQTAAHPKSSYYYLPPAFTQIKLRVMKPSAGFVLFNSICCFAETADSVISLE